MGRHDPVYHRASADGVVSQSPAPGTKAKADQTVKLILK